MALITNVEINISINDEGIGFVEKEPGMTEVSNYSEVRLPKGVVKNGYIKEPEILLNKLKTIFKNFKIKTKNVRWIISEQNAILRDITINKDDIQGKSVEEYIKGQIGKTIHFPFKKPIFHHFVKEDDEEKLRIILYILDENMLHDYLDVFDRLKIRNVTYEMPALALFRLLYQDDEEKSEDGIPVKRSCDIDEEKLIDGLMVFQMFDSMFSLTVFEKEYPVFALMDDMDDTSKLYETTEQYISRIANYYKFNLTGGKKQINKIVIFNLTSNKTNEDVQTELDVRLKGMNYEIFEMEKKSEYYSKILPTSCYVALGSSLYK